MSKDPSQEGPLRILLVEDDLDQGYLVRFLLEADGRYQVTLAQDGIRGSTLVEREPWALVITDLNLPGKDGLQVVQASRRHRPETPILAATSQEGREPVRLALAGGADDVLVKPFSRDDLLQKVEALIARGPRPAPARLPLAPDPEEELPPYRLRVLAVSVRPGDAEVGCGGTLLLHRERGDRVTLLTLTRGGKGEVGIRRGEGAKAAGRAMDVRYFVGNAGSGSAPLEEDLRRLARNALTEVRPELLYLPTRGHGEEIVRVVHDALVGEAVGAAAIFAYNPGDATARFRPTHFVPIARTLAKKGLALQSFDPADGDHLTAEFSATSARFWGRDAGGVPAEALEALRGELPPEFTDPSLLRPGGAPLE